MHIAAVHDAEKQEMKLYVDGQSVASASAPSSISEPGGNVLIGNWRYGDAKMNMYGIMDEVLFSSTAMSDLEVAVLFHNYKKRKQHERNMPRPIARYLFPAPTLEL